MSSFDFSAQELAPGKLVPFTLDMLPGKPVVWLEHLGDENASWLSEQILQANATKTVGRERERKLSKRQLDDARARNREILAKHAVRKLDAKRKDGSPATAADIPDFCQAIPNDVVDTLITAARNPEWWRDVPDASPDDLAGK